MTPADRPDGLGPIAAAAIDRQLLDQIFGDVLPSTTNDEREPDGSGSAHHGYSEQWYRDNRPPHNGG